MESVAHRYENFEGEVMARNCQLCDGKMKLLPLSPLSYIRRPNK